MSADNVNGFVNVNDNVNGRVIARVKVNDTGVQYIQKHKKVCAAEPVADAVLPSAQYDNDLVNSLLEQLKRKDEQIEQLLKQAENYQILLGQKIAPPFIETYTEEPPKKRHWWNRKKEN